MYLLISCSCLYRILFCCCQNRFRFLNLTGASATSSSDHPLTLFSGTGRGWLQREMVRRLVLPQCQPGAVTNRHVFVKCNVHKNSCQVLQERCKIIVSEREPKDWINLIAGYCHGRGSWSKPMSFPAVPWQTPRIPLNYTEWESFWMVIRSKSRNNF